MSKIRLTGYNSSIIVDLEKLSGSQIDRIVRLCGEYSDAMDEFDLCPVISPSSDILYERMDNIACIIKDLMYQGRV
jgi:hypothetical protein